MTGRWQVEIVRSAQRELNKLTPNNRQRILNFMEERIARGNPRNVGHALTGELAGLWSYRIGDFRLIARIEDRIVTVVVLRVGNRREVYR